MKQYKTIAGPIGLTISAKQKYADAVKQYAAIIDREAVGGWELKLIQKIFVQKNKGCLAGLLSVFGLATATETVTFNMLVFVKDDDVVTFRKDYSISSEDYTTPETYSSEPTEDFSTPETYSSEPTEDFSIPETYSLEPTEEYSTPEIYSSEPTEEYIDEKTAEFINESSDDITPEMDSESEIASPTKRRLINTMRTSESNNSITESDRFKPAGDL